MLEWWARKFEKNRAKLQSRLERTLQPAAVTVSGITSEEWRKRGNAYLSDRRLNEAESCYRCGLESNANDAVCYSNLGYVLGEQGRLEESGAMLKRAVELNPADFDAYYMLGNLARSRGEWKRAIGRYRQSLTVNPGFDTCRRDLCVALAHTGELGEARAVMAQGPAFTPGTPDYYFFRGNLHLAASEFDDAMENFLRAAELQPRNASILINLGVAQLRRRDVFAAIETYRGILDLDPHNVQAHANLAAALQQTGQVELAIQSYRHALKLDPGYLNAHQNLLFALTYVPSVRSNEYLQEARLYGSKVSARARAYSQWLGSGNTNGSRPPRVGFVSGDLRTHPVGLFLEGVLAKVDKSRLTLVAYSSSTTEDAVSERLKSLCAEWNSVAAWPDEALAGKIHADRIDVLVDLAGHTGHNRLAVFAWKPAPVQVSWLGYWASTGVAEIDYILVDPVSVPPSEAEFFSEKLWYLPETRLCLTAPAGGAEMELKDLPALKKGHVTFGSYQILNKISDTTLVMWSQVLARLPTSRLRLQSLPLEYPDAVADMHRRMTLAGIDMSRVDLHGGTSREAYLASYGEVDVVLDTYPFPGGTTTAEALWMGVPTVTMSGDSLLARQGKSLLTCVGLAEWVANSESQYVDVALARVSDLTELAKLRASLRARALASPLFDATEFAKQLEDAFMGMTRQKAGSCERQLL
jgi:protein O-GlcNAc transferase